MMFIDFFQDQVQISSYLPDLLDTITAKSRSITSTLNVKQIHIKQLGQPWHLSTERI